MVYVPKGIAERRKHKRFPVITGLVKPVLFRFPRLNIKGAVPGILSNLSAGGVALVTFAPVQLNVLISLTLDFDGLKLEDVEGRVVRVEAKNEVYLVAIEFTQISDKTREKINSMAEDFDMCDTRIILGEKGFCKRSCSYYELCTKPVKKRE